MRILWVGDAVTSTGFARCTHAAAAALHRRGHDVHVIGINYWGDPHNYPYTIYPAYHPLKGGKDIFGAGRLVKLVDRLEPDEVVLLNDPWNIKAYLQMLNHAKHRPAHITGWLAVDAKNQRGEELTGSDEEDGYRGLDHVVTWTSWALDELRRGGYNGPGSVVPLGVDRRVFQPLNRDECRPLVVPDTVPQDAFIIGVVGRNQPRKRLDLSIAYFAEFLRQHRLDNVWLYLHVAPTGERGCDIKALADYYGVAKRTLLNSPGLGGDLPDELMSALYNSFDLYWSTTSGEGWGLPALEAMACGIPCLLPDWSAFSDWAQEGAYLVPCDNTCLNAPLNDRPFTIGGVPGREATVSALGDIYFSQSLREELAARAFSCATLPAHQWKNVGSSFAEVLEAVAADAFSEGRRRDDSPPERVGVEEDSIARRAGPEGVWRAI